MEWEKKFYDIVRETESNLANARRKLQGNGLVKTPQTQLDYLSPSRPRTTSWLPASSTSFVNNNDHINSIRQSMGWSQPAMPYSSSSSLPAPVLLTGHSTEMRELQSKIDFQNLMIDRLERLVKTMNQEREQYQKQIKDLQSEVGHISLQLNDSRFADPHLETQVDLMRHEVRSDMQRLQSMINSCKPHAQYPSSLERSFKDMQHNVHGELEDLRRELNSTTHRVGLLELDVSTHGASQRDLCDRIKGDMLRSSTSRLGQSSSFLNSQPSPVAPGELFQIRELRSTVDLLHGKLDNLESRLATSRSSPHVQAPVLNEVYPKTPAKSYQPVGRKVMLKDFLDDDDDIDDDDEEDDDGSDLDLSDDLNGLDVSGLKDDEEDEGSLSDDIDEIIKMGKTFSTTAAKKTAGSLKSSEKKTFPAFQLSDSSEDLLSDLDLDNLDLDSVASYQVDLDSVDGTGADLNLDDL